MNRKTKTDKVEVRNPNAPGHITRVDLSKYNAMYKALNKIIPTRSPGLTGAEILDGCKKHLSEELFPGGAKAGWWAKTVQLDLEAQGKWVREDTKPLRWYKVN